MERRVLSLFLPIFVIQHLPLLFILWHLFVGKTTKHHGIIQFGGYLITGNFYIDHAIESSAKAAYLAAKIKLRDHTPLTRYDGKETTFQFETMPFNTLNRLRKIKSDSLHHWSQTAALLKIK